MMAAHLRLPETQSDEEKEAYVDSLIARLGMVKSKNTIVGDAKARLFKAQRAHLPWNPHAQSLARCSRAATKALGRRHAHGFDI